MAEAEDQIVRRILTAIEDDASISQRKLSGDIGIAVGSVNWHLKRCVNKGLIKLKQAPVKRYLYYLTPKGFEEKARLTASFIQSSFSLYRLGRKECADYFSACAERGHHNIFLAGDGDFAEVAVLGGLDSDLPPAAVIDARSERSVCVGVPVVPSLDAAFAYVDDATLDKILVTDLQDPRKAYEQIVASVTAIGLDAERVDVPRMLNFKPKREVVA